MANSERTSTPPPEVDDAVELANRVRAMLARWATESVTGEPDWSIEDIAPIALERNDGNRNPAK